MRISRTFAAFTIAGAAALVLVGCSSGGPVESDTTPTAARATPTPTQSPSAAAAPQVGSRENPYGYDKSVQYDATSIWTFTWKSTKADGWPDIQAANEFNTAPAAGENFVLGTVAYGTSADAPADGASPTASWGVYYVGNDGNSYQSLGECGQLPGSDVLTAQPMYPNASQTGTVCAKVPTAAVSGGTWVIRAFAGSDASVYFKGAD